MKYKQPIDFDTALRIYYTYPEINNAIINELFGGICPNTCTKYKREVKRRQIEEGIKTFRENSVNTEVAFEVWGIDIKDIERRRERLIKLGLRSEANV